MAYATMRVRTTLIVPCLACGLDIIPSQGIVTLMPRAHDEKNLHVKCYQANLEQYAFTPKQVEP